MESAPRAWLAVGVNTRPSPVRGQPPENDRAGDPLRESAMPIALTCPSCSARLNAPDTAAGKRIKCPKCQAVCPVPPAAPAFEVVEDAAPARALPAAEAAAEDELPRRRPAD